jgi:ABC-type taurine transport system substrate-binding protein
MLLVQQAKIIGAADPQDYTGAAFAGQYVSLKNYNHLTVIIHTGAWAGGTAAVTMRQATDVAAGTNKALNCDYMWTGTAASGALTKTAVTADTFNLAAANTMYVIEVDAQELDTTLGYDCVSVLIATPGVNADLYNVDYILSQPRFSEDVPPTAILD